MSLASIDGFPGPFRRCERHGSPLQTILSFPLSLLLSHIAYKEGIAQNFLCSILWEMVLHMDLYTD